MPAKYTRGKRRGAEASKERVVAAADKLFVEKGYSGASMNEIAKAAKVNKSLIYHHFASKDELWNEVLFRHMDGFFQMQRDLFSDPQQYSADYFKDIIRSIFQYLKEHPDSTRIFQWSNLESRHLKESKIEKAEQWIYFQVMFENIRRGQDAESLRNDIPSVHILNMLLGMVFYWFQAKERLLENALNPEAAVYDEHCLDSIIKLFFQGTLPQE